MKILVVGDNFAFGESVVAIMSGRGHDATAVSAPLEATDGASSFDLVVVDADGGLQSAMALCSSVRQQSPGATVPLVLVLNVAVAEDLPALFDSGADDVLLAPFEANELNVRVDAAGWRLRKDRERAARLHEAEALVSVFVEQNTEAMFMASPDGRFLEANQRALDLLGYSREELLDRSLHEVIAPESLALTPLRSDELPVGAPALFIDRVLVRKDGERVPVEIHAGKFPDGRLFSIIHNISARKQAESVAVRLAAMVQGAEDGMATVSLEGNILAWNPGMERLYGYTAEEAIGRPIAEVVRPPGEQREEQRRLFEAAREGRPASTADVVRLRRDGTPVNVSHSTFPIRDREGRVIAVGAVQRDITARRRAEEKAQAARRFLEAAIDAMPGLCSVISATGERLLVNAGYRQLFGDQEAATFNPLELVYVAPEDREVVRRFTEEVLADGRSVAEITLTPPGGRRLRYHYSGARADYEGQRCIVAVGIDVTSQREAEEAKEQYLKFFMLSIDAMCIADPFGCFKQVNPAFTRMTGYTESELVSKPFLDFVVPEDRQRTAEEMELQVSTRSSLDFENRYVCKDGTTILLSWNAYFDRNDGVTYATARNITEMRRLADALADSERRLRLHVRETPVAVIEWDTGFRVRSWNPAAERIFGYAAEEAIGQHGSMLIPEAARPLVDEIFARLLARDGGERSTNENLTKDGRTIVCEWSNTPLVSADGTVIGVASLAQDVTERRRAEEALRESQYVLNQAQRVAKVGSWHWDAPTDTITWSDELYRIAGRDPADGTPGYEDHLLMYTPESAARLNAAVEEAMANGTPYALDMDLVRPDGTTLAVVARAEAVRDQSGRVVALRGTLQDITERKRAEESLRQSEERYRLVAEAAHDHIFIVDRSGRLEYINDFAAAALGLRPEELVGREMASLFPPEIGREQSEGLQRVFQGGAPVYAERQSVLTTGEVWLSTWLSPLFDAAGQVRAALGIARDITEQRATEAALRRSESLLAQTQAISHTGGWEYDVASGTVVWTDEVYRIYDVDRGYDPSDIARAISFYAPNDQAAVERAFQRAVEDGEPYSLEVSFVSASGSRKWVRTSGQAERVDGKVVRVFGHITDVTERRTAEDARRESEERFHAALEAMPVGIWVYDGEQMVMTNETASAMSGYSREEMADPGYFARVLHPDDRAMAADRAVRRLRGEPVEDHFETRIIRADGEVRTHETWAVPIVLGGRPATMVAATDITDRKKAEEERLALVRRLLEAESRESLGLLAGGLAHQFNNLLAAMVGNASLTLMELGDASTVRPYLDEILASGHRGAELARQMLAYSGRSQQEKSLLQLNDIAAQSADLLRQTIPENVTLTCRLAPHLPPIEADAGQLRQVIMNLATNGAEAIGSSHGEVRISTALKLVESGNLDSSYTKAEKFASGEHLVLEVRDTGAGMTDETRLRIFEPFFSTRFAGRGLGMAAVLGIVRAHDGAISVQSEPGQGTVVRVFVPVPRAEE